MSPALRAVVTKVPMGFQEIEGLFEDAVTRGIFPGAVLLAARGDEVVLERAFGYRSLVPAKTPLTLDAVFDLASLTKPLATSLALLALASEGRIHLDDSVTLFLPTFGQCGKDKITIAQLLAHTSGLPAWQPLYEKALAVEHAERTGVLPSTDARKSIMSLVHRQTPGTPPGCRSLYSDLGFIVLGELVECVTGMRLDDFCRQQIYRPLGIETIGFIDLTGSESASFAKHRIVPTEESAWRGKIICGEVHDDNAYAMGGIAGHAGLFASARALHHLLSALRRCLRGSDDTFPAVWLRKFLSRDDSVANPRFALGWDTPSAVNSASGTMFSPQSVGHLGFTGASFWWDLTRDCYIILLTNRVHPTRKNEAIREFRPRAHDLIMKAILP
jgi:CubicO group peptidase (beta-lactamase class C family)